MVDTGRDGSLALRTSQAFIKADIVGVDDVAAIVADIVDDIVGVADIVGVDDVVCTSSGSSESFSRLFRVCLLASRLKLLSKPSISSGTKLEIWSIVPELSFLNCSSTGQLVLRFAFCVFTDNRKSGH